MTSFTENSSVEDLGVAWSMLPAEPWENTCSGKSGCWSLPDRMGILTDPVRQVTMALGMMRGVVDALARLRS